MAQVDIAKLRARLKAVGRTQKQLADHLGVANSEVSKYLSGKHKMGADRYLKIEEFLADAERKPLRGVAEAQAAFEQHRLKFVTLDEARITNRAPRMSEEERERWYRELRELGEAAKRLPRITEMSDDEILGYEEP